jgi:hypothetical protein
LLPDANRPAERWFLAINPWMSRNHPIVKVTLEWLDEWVAKNATEVAAVQS